MDLRSRYPFWLVKNGIPATYPPLDRELETDVVVLGAGITGALTAYELMRREIDVVVLDKRDAAWGSTSASTGLLQYEIDTDLHELTDLIGRERATRAYWLGVEAIEALAAIVHELGVDCHFRPRDSLYVARRRQDEKQIRAEFEARRRAGFAVQMLERATLIEQYGMNARCAILSEIGAEVDPYLLTYHLLGRCLTRGVRIFDRTTMQRLIHHDGEVVVETDRNYSIRAKKVIFATGYESQLYLKQDVGDLNSSFAVVTEPLAAQPLGDTTPPIDYLMWEAARPYLYVRNTVDGRLIIGGEDEPFRDPEKRDRLISKKSARLLKRFQAFYPDHPLPEIAFSWAGTFGETKDGLAYIGETEEVPNAYWAMGYGGNGITWSMIASRILADLYQGVPNADAHLFRLDR
ncbi:MAG: FAD-dependent oxidoreductase [Litorilinea sp.]